MEQLLAKIFDFFKTKSPRLFAIMVIVIGAVYGLQEAGIIHLPQAVVNILVSLGLVSGTHTSSILKK